MTQTLKAPFPFFGGKATIAPLVWQWLGDCPNFVEPFFGSGAVLLARPNHDPARHLETANDADGLVSNFYRALQAEPDAVAWWADWPVNENDLHARHAWLVEQKDSLQTRLEGDPDYYDVKIAGWWVWGMAVWIGDGFCSGKGPWQVRNGLLVHLGNAGQGVRRKLVHLGSGGQGVERKLVHLGNGGRGVHRQLVHLGDGGQGVERKRVHLGNGGLSAWCATLADRLRRVRVCCGDWARVCGPSVTWKQGLTGVFFDPPYGAATGRMMDMYRTDSGTVSAEVRQWCLTHGQLPFLRIVLCGYGEEHDGLLGAGWRKHTWAAQGGYGLQGQGTGRANRLREACWISPHCCTLEAPQLVLPFRWEEERL